MSALCGIFHLDGGSTEREDLRAMAEGVVAPTPPRNSPGSHETGERACPLASA
jgi:hypothetical protein